MGVIILFDLFSQAKLFQIGRHNTLDDKLVLYEDEVKKLWKGNHSFLEVLQHLNII